MKVDLVRTIEIKDRNGRVVGTKEVVTYPGLLSKAHEEGLAKVETTLVQVPSDENGRTAIAKVVIETAKGRFEAIGDASPENVNSFIAPHLIRMAETRAKSRALRDAVNVGILSFEELDGGGSFGCTLSLSPWDFFGTCTAGSGVPRKWLRCDVRRPAPVHVSHPCRPRHAGSPGPRIPEGLSRRPLARGGDEAAGDARNRRAPQGSA